MHFRAIPRQKPYCSVKDFILSVKMFFDGMAIDGTSIRAFETEFRTIFGSRFAITASSCRSVFALVVDALGIQPGDEVILPALNLPAFPNILLHKKIKPVFVDIHNDTLTIDPALIESSITDKTKAIVAVHLFGNVCDMEPIVRIARQYNIPIIEDCANAYRTEYKGRYAGTFGDVACFSFGASKDISTFGGGMAITNNEQLYRVMRRLYEAKFAFPSHLDLFKNILKNGLFKLATTKYCFLMCVYPVMKLFSLWNFDAVGEVIEEKDKPVKKIVQERFTNFQAALGLTRLKDNNRMQRQRIHHARIYDQKLFLSNSIKISKSVRDGGHAYWNYVIQVPNRQDILKKLFSCGIDAKAIHTYDCNQLNIFSEFKSSCPVSAAVSERLVGLPVYHSLTSDDIRFMADQLTDAQGRGSGLPSQVNDENLPAIERRVLLLRLTPKAYQNLKHPVGHRPPYPLKYIEALLHQRGRYDVRCIDQQVTDLGAVNIQQIIREWKPQIVVFEVTTLNAEASGQLCAQLNSSAGDDQIISVAIGQHVSADVSQFRQQYSQYNLCFAGEAEQEVVSVIERIFNGATLQEISSYYDKAGKDRLWAVSDLESLPFLHYDHDALRAYNFVYPLRLAKKLVWGHMITSRGCPHPCMFCAQLMRESYGTKMRYKSAGRAVDEMEHLLGLGANIIAVDDEDFTTSKRHVEGICDEILRRNLKVHWIIHGRVDELNPMLLDKLSASGCVLIRMGMETGSKRILKLLEKTKKPDVWLKQSREVVRTAQARGISVACLFMVGIPTETKQEVMETIEFAKKLNPDIIQVSYFTPFPGTKAYVLYKDQIAGYKTEDFYHYSFPKFNLSHMSDFELQQIQSLFYKKYLLRPAFMVKHLSGNFLFYLTNFNIFFRLLWAFRKF